MSEQDDFYLDVERAIAEHKRMKMFPEIPEMPEDGKDLGHLKSALKELRSLPKDELQRRWAEIQKRNRNKGR